MLTYISSLKKLQSECTEKLKFHEDLLKKAYDIIDKVQHSGVDWYNGTGILHSDVGASKLYPFYLSLPSSSPPSSLPFPSSPLRFLSSFLPSPLNQVVSLLSLGSFIEVMSQLVKGAGGAEGGGGARETRDDVQKKTLEILNTKLEGTRLRFTEEHVSNGAQHHYNRL